MTKWLKIVGVTGDPLRDDWTAHVPTLLKAMTFARQPGEGSFISGGRVVYYALSDTMSRVVALGEVLRRPRHDPAADPGWPWLVDARLDHTIPLVHEGFPLDSLNVDGGRDLRRSVRQQSHIRLTDDEYRNAVRLFAKTGD